MIGESSKNNGLHEIHIKMYLFFKETTYASSVNHFQVSVSKKVIKWDIYLNDQSNIKNLASLIIHNRKGLPIPEVLKRKWYYILEIDENTTKPKPGLEPGISGCCGDVQSTTPH